MLQKLLTPLPFFHISFLWKTASNVHLKMKTIIFDRNLYILNGIVNCKHSTTTKNFWMNPFSIITKGGEGNLQIFDRMNFDFSLQINGGWRWVEQLFLSLSLWWKNFKCIFRHQQCVQVWHNSRDWKKNREIPVMNSSRARSGNRKNFSLANLISQ